MIRIIINWILNGVYLFIYLLSFAKITVHEGFHIPFINLWVNWCFSFAIKTKKFVYIRKVDDVVQEIQNNRNIRVAGAGHSFNSGPLSDCVMLNLDKFNRIIEINCPLKTVTVEAGIRLRDLIKAIEHEGLTFPILGSTDAQSIGGLVATDLHGTSNSIGSISDMILELTLVDGNGDIRTLRKDKDPELYGVTGGIGGLGVVVRVTFQCVDLFHLYKEISVVKICDVETNIGAIFDNNDHVSLYYMGGAQVESCRIQKWNRTVQAVSMFYKFRLAAQEISEFILTAFLMGLARAMCKSTQFATIGFYLMKLLGNQSVIATAGVNFTRKLYYRHDEMEFGVPFEHYSACMQEIQGMLVRNHFFTVVEVRFIHSSKSLIGPGSGRKTVMINLCPSLSTDSKHMFESAALIFQKYSGQPHLGKNFYISKNQFKEVHGSRYDEFIGYRNQFDPLGKFHNDLLDKLFSIPADI